jgi:hypothetical protein
MWRRITIVGATAAIVGGAGTAAFAASGASGASGADAPTPSPASASATSDQSAGTPKGQGGTRDGANRLRRTVHATWVTENKKTRTFTTHDAIRGLVTVVSPTSITVRAADNLTETFVVSSSTKVHTRAIKTGALISDVKAGDPVFVGGTGTTTLTAVRVVDAKK